MMKPASVTKPDQSKSIFFDENNEQVLTRGYLREEIKAHLDWCIRIQSSVDKESLNSLAEMLRQNADVMHAFANLAEKYALNKPNVD